MVEYLIPIGDVWEYYKENEASLRNTPQTIAKNENQGVVVSLMSYALDESYVPYISVEVDKEEVFHKIVFSGENGVIDVLCNISNELEQGNTSALYNIDKATEVNHTEEINDREEELMDAFYELINVIASGNDEAEYELIDVREIEERTLAFLYEAYRLSPYRPMYLPAEDGGEHFAEYPYPFLDIDSILETFNV